MTIQLPRRVSSDSFSYGSPPEGCYAACILMLLVYWRTRFPDSAWKAPASPDSDEWLKAGKSLFAGTSVGGADSRVVKEKKVPEVLRGIKAAKDLAYEEKNVVELIESAQALALKGIPSIMFFDSFMLYKGLRSGGSVHSGIFLDYDGRAIKLADPSNLGPLGYQVFQRESFDAAVSEIPKTLAYFYPIREVQIAGYRAEVSLEKWLKEG